MHTKGQSGQFSGTISPRTPHHQPSHVPVSPRAYEWPIRGTALYPKHPSQLTAIYPDSGPFSFNNAPLIHPGTAGGKPSAPTSGSRRPQVARIVIPSLSQRPIRETSSDPPFTPDRRANAFFSNGPNDPQYLDPLFCSFISRPYSLHTETTLSTPYGQGTRLCLAVKRLYQVLRRAY